MADTEPTKGCVLPDRETSQRVAAVARRAGGIHHVATRFGVGADGAKRIADGRSVRRSTLAIVRASLACVEEAVELERKAGPGATNFERLMAASRF